jgi:TonB family protein
MQLGVLSIFAASALISSAASAINSAPLQPIAPWVLDYDVAECHAERQYNEDHNAVTFAIRPAPNGETYELLIARTRAGPRYGDELRGEVDFGAGPIKAWLLNYGTTNPVLNVLKFRIPAAEMAQAQTANSVTFRIDGAIAGSSDIAFSLHALPGVLAGLKKCTEMLRHYWNMTPDEAGLIASPARGDMHPLFSPSDYPEEAMKHDQEGSSQFLLLINEKGRVAGCHVIKASGVPALDSMGCEIFRKRANFTPALNHQGIPIRSAVTTPPIVWSIR